MADVALIVESWGQTFDFLVEDGGTAVNISAATLKELYFRRPDNTLLKVNSTNGLSFKTDGTDGYLRWTIAEGQLRKRDAGEWRVEAQLEGVPTFNGPTFPASFVVQDRLR